MAQISSEWCAKDDTAVTAAMRVAVQASGSLQGICVRLREEITQLAAAGVGVEGINSLLEDASPKSASLDSFFRSMTGTGYYQELHISEEITKGREVFDIPELLETILSYLSVTDLLQVQLVNKRFSATIISSPKLQIKLGLREAENKHFSMPLEVNYPALQPLPGLSCGSSPAPETPTVNDFGLAWKPKSLSGEWQPGPTSLKVIMSFTTNQNGRLPTVGEHFRRMLVSQPSPKAMTPSFKCCGDGRNGIPFIRSGRSQAETVDSVSGLTVGDLLNPAHTIVQQHRLCANASATKLNRNGYVKLCIKLGFVHLLPNDPLVVAYREKLEAAMSFPQVDATRKARLSEYTQAKKTASTGGEDIPTLAEWEATHPWEAGEQDALPATLPPH